MPYLAQDFKEMLSPLPIDAVLPEIVRAFTASRNLVIEAPPGAGKTTRVPPALLDLVRGEVIVLEPRRIAARMAARRLAEELGEKVGETVGYQVRFEDVSGPGTRLRFVTEGVLTRRLLSDPDLRTVSAVVLDEFHERHLDADLALALLRRLQTSSRPDLKLLVMSATLNAGPISAYLDGCAIVRSEGRTYDVAISYTPYSRQPLEEQVAAAVFQSEDDGDVLVFLPGAAEIRRSMRSCSQVAGNAVVLPLHGDLSPEEQDRAVLPADRRKIILATNVAESSITIDGITTVIDSGLARIASDSPWTGLPTLDVQRISKASATQRAGRAGRTRPGHAIRLYTADDFQRRPESDVPEIRRRELSQTVLELLALRIRSLDWFEAPPSNAMEIAEALLDRLGAAHDIADLARLPVHPRLARMILEGNRRGAGVEACRLAALLSAGDRFPQLDVLDAIEQETSWRSQQIEKQLRRLVKARSNPHEAEEAMRLAVLAGFPDRVARRRTDTEVQLSNGKAAKLASVWRTDLLVAVDVEERSDADAPLIRLASEVTPEALVELFPDRIEERTDLVWNRQSERVEASAAVLFDGLIIDETRITADPVSAGRLLADRALDAGLTRFVDAEEMTALLARSEFASQHSNLPRLQEDDAIEVLRELCSGLRSFAELRSAAEHRFFTLLKERVGGERALNEIAPERLQLKNRQVKVHYATGQRPWIASRLQDFFGLRETPTIAKGQVAVLAHLLAPNQRPVQMTTDLAGFWERLYPQVRRELARRYPRHSWPENPAA
ncbi:MAG TPA: ATP-dependent helicase HrpB [Bryobacteraceae bacterium]|nr:ATP-dependent helicase HrpB [Bryobacteraceae bacterium]